MKIHKRRNLFGLIYALIMLLPLSSVLFRCGYVMFNKNAFESYYGETINDKQYQQVTNFVVGETYDVIVPTTNTYERKTNHTEISVENVFYNGESKNCSGIRVYVVSGGTALTFQGVGEDSFIFSSTNNVTLQFTFLAINNNNYLDDIKTITYSISYNKYSYLDNAFEYSLDNFVGRNGRGALNLTDWFTDVFLQRSDHTMLYLDFINWYMNYTLLISCVYLLYLVLMWFISLARRILTKYEEV